MNRTASVQQGTFVSQLDVEQRVHGADGCDAHGGVGVGAAGGQPAQQGAQVVEGDHVLASDRTQNRLV